MTTAHRAVGLVAIVLCASIFVSTFATFAPIIEAQPGGGSPVLRASPIYFIHPDVVTVTVHTAAMELARRSAPPPAALDSSVRIFVHASNTTGKSLLCAQFRTGVPQCFSQEP